MDDIDIEFKKAVEKNLDLLQKDIEILREFEGRSKKENIQVLNRMESCLAWTGALVILSYPIDWKEVFRPKGLGGFCKRSMKN